MRFKKNCVEIKLRGINKKYENKLILILTAIRTANKWNKC